MAAGSALVAIGRGNVRKPTAIKQQQGTERAARRNPNEPRPDPIRLAGPPAHLNEREAAAWRSFAQVVNPLRIMTPGDIAAFEQMVCSWALCTEAQQALRRPLLVPDAPRGKGTGVKQRRARKSPPVGTLLYVEWTPSGARVKPRPELNIIATHQKILLYQFSRFGLTPADRSRVSELEDGDGGAKSGTIGEFE